MLSRDFYFLLNSYLNDFNAICAGIKQNKLGRMSPYLIRYTILIASSCVEKCVKCMLTETLTEGSNSHAINYIHTTLNMKTFNPTSNNLSKLLKYVDDDLYISLKRDHFVVINRVLERLNDLVGLRNKVAHGDTLTETITTIRQHFYCCIILLRRLHFHLKQLPDKTVLEDEIETTC